MGQQGALRSQKPALGRRSFSPVPPCASLLLVLLVLTLRMLGSVVQRAASFDPMAGGSGSRNREAGVGRCLFSQKSCLLL